MPVSFKKKAVQPAPEPNVNDDDIPFDTDDVDVPVVEAEAPVPTAATTEAPAKLPEPTSAADRASRYAYTGEKAKAVYEKADNESNIPYRFRMKIGEERKVTFLDGDIDPDSGFFKNLMIHEHTVALSGQYPTYVCTERAVNEADNEPCPICAADRGPYLICFFTVIDHTGYVNNQGKRVENITRVFGAKRRTTSKLLRIAAKRGGLAGARFDISRLDGEANTGETFEFTKKFDVEALCDKYKTKVVDYSTVTNFKTRDELLQLGIGGTPIGAESMTVPGSVVNIDEDL